MLKICKKIAQTTVECFQLIHNDDPHEQTESTPLYELVSCGDIIAVLYEDRDCCLHMATGS